MGGVSRLVSGNWLSTQDWNGSDGTSPTTGPLKQCVLSATVTNPVNDELQLAMSIHRCPRTHFGPTDDQKLNAMDGMKFAIAAD